MNGSLVQETTQFAEQTGVIAWCNANTGFVSAVLSLSTILLSIIAIAVSIRTARLPYKKELQLRCGSEYSGRGHGIYITAINMGNRPITIWMMGLQIEEKQLVIPAELANTQCKVLPTDHVSQHFEEDELIRLIITEGFSRNSSIYAYVLDSEGERYQQYVCSVKDIIKE